MDKVKTFLKIKTIAAPGCKAKVADLWQQFLRWLPVRERPAWDRRSFGRALADAGVLIGTSTSNHQFAGNLLWPTSQHVLRDGKLALEPIG